MALDEGAACMANRTYHVHPHTGDTWHYAFPGEDGMESIASLPECERQGTEISALARVAEEWVRETGGVEQGTWAVGAIPRARYRRGESMTREDTKAIFPPGDEGASGGTEEGTGSPHHPPGLQGGRQGDGGSRGTPRARGKIPVQCAERSLTEPSKKRISARRRQRRRGRTCLGAEGTERTCYRNGHRG